VVRHDQIGDPLLRPLAPVSRARPLVSRYRGISTVTLIAAALYLVISLTRYRSFIADGYDLGIFDQVVRAYAHFQAPLAPLKGQGYNIFGDHFHPIIATLAPLYWIWDNPCSLLIGQAIVVAASIPVVYRFVRRRTSEPAALLISAGYAIGWPILSLIDFDFHEIAFANLFMALAIDAYDRRRDRQLLIWCGLLLLVREDMGILVALFGLFVVLRDGWTGFRHRWLSRTESRRSASVIALTLIIGGGLAYKITTGVVLPHFAPNHEFAYWQYQSLGDNLPDALWGILTRPWHAIDLFFTPILKTQTLLYFLVPVLGLALRSPYLLFSLPIFAERFFNSRPSKEYLWSTHWQYNALPWVILLLAAVDGATRLGLLGTTTARNRRAHIFGAVFGVWLLAVAAFLAVTSNERVPWPPNPLRRITAAAWDTTPRMKAQTAASAVIPDNACVEADDRIVAHLARRTYASLPGMQAGTADFVILDLSEDNVGNFGPSPLSVQAKDLAAGYTTVFSQATIVVLRSPSYAGPSVPCHPLGGGR